MQHDPDGLCGRPERHGLQLPPAEPGPGGAGGPAGRAPFAGRVERVVLYRWDRAYPADLYWDLSLEGWTLARREEFPGFSHEIITKEVYIP